MIGIEYYQLKCCGMEGVVTFNRTTTIYIICGAYLMNIFLTFYHHYFTLLPLLPFFIFMTVCLGYLLHPAFFSLLWIFFLLVADCECSGRLHGEKPFAREFSFKFAFETNDLECLSSLYWSSPRSFSVLSPVFSFQAIPPLCIQVQ